MDNIEVKVDNEVECWLCGNLCSEIGSNREDSVDLGTCFKMLLRYLNIDLGKIRGLVISEVFEGVRLCEGCDLVMKEFLEWYQNLEAVRLCLGNIILSVSQILRKREDSRVTLGGLSDGQYNPDNLDTLRNMLISNCQDKLVSKPRVKLNEVNIPIPKVDRPPPLPLKTTIDLPQEDDNVKNTPQRKKKGEGISPCKFCNKTFSKTGNAKIHSQLRHTFLHFSSELPKGTTQSKLESVIKVITEKYVDNKDKKKIQICTLCKKPFRHGDHRRLHIITTHWHEVISSLKGKGEEYLKIYTSNLHQCRICKKSFKTRGALYLHKNHHHKVELPIKMKSSADKTKLRKISTISLLPGKEKNVKCKYCPKTFTQEVNAHRHCIQHHTFLYFSKELPPGTTQSQLEDGVKSVMEKNLNQCSSNIFKCTQCRKTFTHHCFFHLHTIKKHWKEVLETLKGSEGSKEGEGGKPTCEFCNKTFNSRHYAIKHSIYHHTFLHFCNVLPPNTTQPQFENAILSVQKKHLNEKPLECLTCKKKKIFQRKWEIRYHVVKSHWDEVIDGIRGKKSATKKTRQNTLNVCRICKKSFETKRALRLHKTCHKVIKINPRRKKYSNISRNPGAKFGCKFCPLRLSDRRNLQRHLIAQHTFRHYFDKIPHGVTRPQLGKAIETTRKKIFDVINKKCLKCMKTFTGKSLERFHIIKSHWKEIVKTLKSTDKGKCKVVGKRPVKKAHSGRKRNNSLKPQETQSNPSEGDPTPPNKEEELQSPIVNGPTLIFSRIAMSYLGTTGSSVLPTICFSPQAPVVAVPDKKTEREETHPDFEDVLNFLKVKGIFFEDGKKCSYCGRQFKEKNKLIHHLTTIHTRQLFDNLVPKDVTDKKLIASVWALIKCPLTTSNFNCDLCLYTSSNSSIMKVHVLQNHMDHVVAYLRMKDELIEDEDGQRQSIVELELW